MKGFIKISPIPLLVMGLVLLITNSCKEKVEPNVDKIADGDGNIYTSVTIGTQTWLSENLKTTTLNDGTPIQNITNNTDWSSLTTPGYCWYNNSAINKNTYGALYNWHTIGTDKICPTGWHVAGRTEWVSLIDFLGGTEEAGPKVKEVGTSHWQSPNNSTNETKFTALPGGFRQMDGRFMTLGIQGFWWTANELNEDVTWAWYYMIANAGNGMYLNNNYKKYGYSVRCIKDN